MELPSNLLSDNLIRRGVILHSADLFKNIDHGKFFVVIGCCDQYVAGCFFINTAINAFVKNKPHFLKLQYLIKRSDYSFLDYDSWLGCHTLIRLTRQSIVDSMIDQHTSIKGQLTSDDELNVLSLCRHSITYSQYEKDTFFRDI